MRPLIPCLLLAGCWVTPDEVDRVVDTDDTDTVVETGISLDITDVAPSWGPSTGGTEVRVGVSPLAEEAQVWFGEVEAEVVSVESDQVLVTAPEGSAGPVHVRVQTSEGEGQLDDGFTYWQDAAGSVGVVGEHSWYEPVGSLSGEPAWGDAWMLFHEPAAVDIHDYFGPPLDTCERDYDWSPGLVEEALGANEVSLRSGTGHTFALDGEGGWFEKETVSADWQEGGRYDLLEIEGHWPAFTVEDIVVNPGSFEVHSPNFDSILPSVSMATNLAWSTTGSADFAVAYLVRYEGDTAVDRVTCTMVDDGSFLVSSSVWSDWSFSYVDYVIMYLGRVAVTETTLPHTRATAATAGAHWVVGVAWQGI